jgi:hypothetical protein
MSLKSLKPFKMPHISGKAFIFLEMFSKSIGFFEKPHITLKKPQFYKNLLIKALIFLKMSSKRFEIFKKASIHIKKYSNSLKISLKCNAFLKIT